MQLEELKKDIYNCVRCGYCREMVYPPMDTYGVCPAYEKLGFESFTGRGKMSMARALLEKRLEISKPMANSIFACAVCGNCSVHCPNEIDIFGVIRTLREEFVRSGIGPMPSQKKYKESIDKNHNPYRESHEKRTQWVPSGIPNKGELVYFAGCTPSYRQESVLESTVKILKASGDGFAMLKDEWCCGSPMYMVGYTDELKDIVGHNIDAVKDAGAKKVVTSCAGCYRMLKLEYPKITGKKLPFEVLHMTQILESAIKEGKIKFKEPINEKITYHDPCHLGRHMGFEGIYEPPRNVLKSIPGIELVEMKRIKKNAWCCMAGGGVKAGFPDLAVWSAAERLKEAGDTGAKNLVSACPFCELNLKDAVETEKSDIKVFDVVDLVAKSMV